MSYTSLFARPPGQDSPPRHAIYLAFRPVPSEPKPTPTGLFSLRARPTQLEGLPPLSVAA